MPARQPSIFVSHGGGPLPLLDDPDHVSLTSWLKTYASTLPETPKAILVFSAHYEESELSITSGSKPSLIYDYGGFPPESYEIKYPAPGCPEIAAKAANLLEKAGFPAKLDAHRGFDHGVFVPMKLAFPDATVPIIAVSQLKSHDPESHWQIGRALRPLRDNGVLIVGSGSSYHNFGGFFGKIPREKAKSDAVEFDQYLTDTIANVDPNERKKNIIGWTNGPAALDNHPPNQEDHLVPFFGVCGAAYDDEIGKRVFSGDMLGVKLNAYEFR